jgi:alpha-tubulin suppressor-like RCC1 family protein
MEKQYFGDSLLWLWGSNSYGKLGDNTGTDRSSPVQTITGGANWKQVACGREHTAAVKTDGTLWLWGENTFGNLGNGNGYILYSSPAETITGGTDWKQVACGYIHTAAIKTDGTLWLWGGNAYGQLGDDTTDNRSSPVQTVTGGTDWKQVACGDSFTVAIKTDGTLWTWGYNGYGQLGDDTTDTKLSPVQTIAGGTNWHQVACGYRHTAAVKNDGTLWTWGRNYNGQLGDDTTDNKSSPVQAITGGTNWKQVACGREHTAAVKVDGTLWAWGRNYNGQLGDDTTDNKSSPVQAITGGTNWKQVACGREHTAAVKADGTLWAWGRNAYGRLGDGTGTGRSSPVQTIMRGTIWKQVACGREHTAAIALGK